MGIQQALEILGRSDIFRDPTGLAGTQRNALAAFKGVMDTAKQFGGTAARLAQQQELGRNVDRTMSQISQARDSGLLTPQQAQDLAHTALQGLVGQPPSGDRSPVHDPAVAQAIDHATQASSGEVSVTTPDETVHASFDDSGSGEAVGAPTPPPKFDDIEQWISLPLIKDHSSGAGPPFPFISPAPIDKLAGLRAEAPLLRVDPGPTVGDSWDALVAQGRLRVDPADPTKFQVRLRLHVCYPSVPGHPGQLAGGGGPAPNTFPLVVIAHGNHASWISGGFTASGTTTYHGVNVPLFKATTITERESHKGYEYLQQELASNGIVSVSIDSNFANFFGCCIQTRAELIKAALNAMRGQATMAGSKYQNRIDFGKTGLMGHSRGGDAVVRATKDLVATPAPPVNIKTVCSLAPTDFTGGAVPAERMFLDRNDLELYHVLYGALDGDVSGEDGPGGPGGTGFRHYDRARCPKAMTFLDRCSHNGFNTVWINDGNDTTDSSCRKPGEHQTLGSEYISALMRWQLNGDPLAGKFDGRVANSLGEHASLQWMFGTSLLAVDDFEHPGTNFLGGTQTVQSISTASAAIEDFASISIAGTRWGPHAPPDARRARRPHCRRRRSWSRRRHPLPDHRRAACVRELDRVRHAASVAVGMV